MNPKEQISGLEVPLNPIFLGTPIGAFDPEGCIFAAGIDSNIIRLYDLRTFDKGLL